MLLFALLFSMSFFAFTALPEDANAGGVTLYIDLDEDTNYNGGGVITPSSFSQRPEWNNAAATTDDVLFAYQLTGTEHATGDTMTLTFPSGYTLSTNCVNPAADTTDADGDGDADGVGTVSGTVYTYTFSSSTTTGVPNGVEFCVRVTTNANATNAAVFLSGTVANNLVSQVMTGGGFLYTGVDGSLYTNDVNVYATVEAVLRFEIMDSTYVAYTNTCDLGTLIQDARATCDYYLKVTTNASSGYVITFRTDGDLRKADSGAAPNTGDVPDADDISRVPDGNAIANGTGEEYGIHLNPGTPTNGNALTYSDTGIDYGTNDSPLPNQASSEVNLLQSDAANAATAVGNSARVDHRVVTDTNTSAGAYHQQVQYYVVARF